MPQRTVSAAIIATTPCAAVQVSIAASRAEVLVPLVVKVRARERAAPSSASSHVLRQVPINAKLAEVCNRTVYSGSGYDSK